MPSLLVQLVAHLHTIANKLVPIKARTDHSSIVILYFASFVILLSVCLFVIYMCISTVNLSFIYLYVHLQLQSASELMVVVVVVD